jgi:superfamily II DNA or RNA helicase
MYKPGRITVVTADSLHKVNAELTDMVIGEEVHELAADSYSAELTRFKNCRMYGFTATPTGRLDNADMRLESLFGPIIFHMTYQEAVDYGLVVPIRVHWLDVICDNPCGSYVDVAKRRHGLWRHQFRNQVIADAAHLFDDEQTLITVTTFEHAIYLRQFLPEFTLCYSEQGDDEVFNRYVKNKMLPADEPRMTAVRRSMLRIQFEKGELKKVIATDVWSTGVSFNGLAVLIRADARGSEIMDSQIPGRVCRLDPLTDKREGLVIDCLDQFDPGFRAAANKRKRNYAAKGWIQDTPRLGRKDIS